MTTAAPAEHPCPRDRVLLVEDSRAIASLLVTCLGRIEGVEAVHVDTLAEARSALHAHAGRLFAAIVDLNLPDAPDGEVVDLVLAAGLPAIILTGSLDETRREALFARNVADYIGKHSLGGVESAVRLVERIHVNRDRAILVVDDSRAQRGRLCALLHNHGYRTLEAADGVEALERLERHPEIRMVLTDHDMPRMSGLELVEQIRRRRSPEELAVIGISAAGERGILARFLKSGANDFLVKPCETEELYCRIDQNLDMLHYIALAREAASRDPLTRLYNRRYFFEHAEVLHRRARDGELSLMLAMIDADHFKRINDRFGHQTGDRALRAIAQVLRGFSGAGFPARFGGEEFVCVQVVSEGRPPAACLESLRRAIEAIELSAPDGERVPLSVSIGATCVPGPSLDDMIERADRAVYRAKAEGRNRVVFVDGGGAPVPAARGVRSAGAAASSDAVGDGRNPAAPSGA